MTLIRWTPFSEIDRIESRINRLLNEINQPTWNRQAKGSLINTPAAELSETDEAFHLKLEVPGMEVGAG